MLQRMRMNWSKDLNGNRLPKLEMIMMFLGAGIASVIITVMTVFVIWTLLSFIGILIMSLLSLIA